MAGLLLLSLGLGFSGFEVWESASSVEPIETAHVVEKPIELPSFQTSLVRVERADTDDLTLVVDVPMSEDITIRTENGTVFVNAVSVVVSEGAVEVYNSGVYPMCDGFRVVLEMVEHE